MENPSEYRDIGFCFNTSIAGNSYKFKQTLFCSNCITNQGIVLEIMQSVDEADDDFKRELELRYPPSCPTCQPKIDLYLDEDQHSRPIFFDSKPHTSCAIQQDVPKNNGLYHMLALICPYLAFASTTCSFVLFVSSSHQLTLFYWPESPAFVEFIDPVLKIKPYLVCVSALFPVWRLEDGTRLAIFQKTDQSYIRFVRPFFKMVLLAAWTVYPFHELNILVWCMMLLDLATIKPQKAKFITLDFHPTANFNPRSPRIERDLIIERISPSKCISDMSLEKMKLSFTSHKTSPTQPISKQYDINQSMNSYIPQQPTKQSFNSYIPHQPTNQSLYQTHQMPLRMDSNPASINIPNFSFARPKPYQPQPRIVPSIVPTFRIEPQKFFAPQDPTGLEDIFTSQITLDEKPRGIFGW